MTTVTFSAAGSVLYAYLAGEIDHASAHRLRETIDTETANRMPETLVLDFTGVGFMDSSGVGLILGRQRRMQVLGGTLRIQHPPAQISKILKLANIQTREETKR